MKNKSYVTLILLYNLLSNQVVNSSDLIVPKSANKIVTFAPNYVCPESFKYDESRNECFRLDFINSKEVCPEGFKLNNNVCEFENLFPVIVECPEGFQLERDNTCSRIVIAPTQIECFDGFVNENGSCQKKIVTEPEKKCENGDLIDNRCVIKNYIKQKAYCPNKYSLVDGKCYSITTFEPEVHCEKPYELVDGSCKQVVYIKPKLECESGSALKGDICFKVYHQKPSKVCENNAKLVQDKCVEQISEEPVLVCSAGSKLINGKCETSEIVSALPICDNPRSNEKCVSLNTQQCPPNYRLISSLECERLTSVAPTLGCSPERNLVNGRCIGYKYYPPFERCTSGNYIEGNHTCEVVEQKSAIIKCPIKHVYNSNVKMCMLEKETPQTLTCKQGTLDPQTNKCVNRVVMEPKTSCPSGSILLKSNLCEIKVSMEVTPVCNENMQLIDDVCKGIIQAPGVPSCLEPFVLVNSQCIYKEVVPSLKVCKDGVLTNAGCLVSNKIQAVYLCDNGYVFNQYNNTCSKVLVSKPLISCLDGEFDENVGSCYKLVNDESKTLNADAIHSFYLKDANPTGQVQKENLTTDKVSEQVKDLPSPNTTMAVEKITSQNTKLTSKNDDLSSTFLKQPVSASTNKQFIPIKKFYGVDAIGEALRWIRNKSSNLLFGNQQ